MSHIQNVKDHQPNNDMVATTTTTSSSVRQLMAEFQIKLNENDERFNTNSLSCRKAPPPPTPPPPPLHRKPPLSPPSVGNRTFERSSSDADVVRKSLGPKPRLAPKPMFLNGSIVSSSASDIHNREVQTPTILVSPAADRSVVFENGFEAENIKSRARHLENLGFVPRGNLPPRNERPISEISTNSQVSDDFDEGDTSASEDETSTVDPSTHSDEMMKQLRRHRHEDDFDELPLPRHDRKTTMCTATHSEIMNEMVEMGFVKGNKLNAVNGKQNGHKTTRRQSNIDEIPADVGKLRDNNRKGRHNSLFVSPSSGASTASDDFSRIASMASDRSSTMTGSTADQSAYPVPDYHTDDEENNKRLKKLHYSAVEFLKVQTNYVQYLKEMAVLYPEYMERFGKRINKDLLQLHNGHENVVLQIKKIVLQILPLHEMLLKEIETVINSWNSETPNMSNTIFTFADFLKCCQPFLDHKADFLEALLKLRNENKEFDEATYMFETEVFKRGRKGAVLQQLDQVHQNFMRYKLLMLRYSEYLVDDTEEKNRALATIEKLEKVTQTVNQKMGLPTTEELRILYDRFQGHFNVLEPGRTLIRQADAMKQTRKEEQHRHLVLFNDCLWICRVSSSNGTIFNIAKSYRIPLEGLRASKAEHEDYSKCISFKSKVRSANFILSSEKERDAWYEDTLKAIHDRRAYRKRQSEAINKEEENRRAKESHESVEEDGFEHVERPSSLRNGRSTDSNEGFSSVPVTPQEELSCPSFVDQTASPSGVVVCLPKKTTSEVKPVWMPDSISTECLMEGCSTEFSLINRRHHCRDCGWLICKQCKGQAPLSKYEFQKQNVCPECFERIHQLYMDGVLFPSSRLITGSDGGCMVRVGKKHESEAVEPRKLFKAPYNYRLRKRNVDEKRESALVLSRVHLRIRKNAETPRHALLRREDLKLVFYKAELDSKPVYEIFLYGYVFRETRLEGNAGWLFELVHRNQIRTDDTKDDVIAFRVDNSASAKRWLAAFQDKLEQDS